MTNRLRVLVVHNRYRALGGEDSVFEAEARALRAHGVEVFIEEFSNHDVPLELGLIQQAKLAAQTVWARKSAQRIASLVREHEIDVVHFHNTFPLVSPAAYRSARRAGAAVVQTLHNYRPICANAMLMRDGGPCEDCVGRTVGWPGVLHGCYQGSRTKSATVVAMQSVHRLAGTWHNEVDCYIALTEFQRQKFIAAGFPAERIAVKPNFVDFDVPPEPDERRGVLFVGRLDEHKGLRVLFDAWEQMPPAHRLTVVGEGPLEAELRARAERMSGVELLGWLEQRRVHELMRGAQVLVMPSLWYEGLPIVLLEAIACETPVIVSRIGALPEVLEGAGWGKLVAPGDSDGLASTLRSLLDPSSLQPAASAAKAAAAIFEARYARGASILQLLACYEVAGANRLKG